MAGTWRKVLVSNTKGPNETDLTNLGHIVPDDLAINEDGNFLSGVAKQALSVNSSGDGLEWKDVVTTLAELSDTDVGTNNGDCAAGDVLMYNFTDSQWEEAPLIGGDGVTATVSDLTNASSVTFDLALVANSGLKISSGQLDLDLDATTIAGTLDVHDGGTGQASFLTNGILYGNGAETISVTAAGSNQAFVVGATGVPEWNNTLPSAVQGNIVALGTVVSGQIGTDSSPLPAYISGGEIDGVTLGAETAITSAVLTTVDIDAGTIDNTAIGLTTQLTGSFTTLEASEKTT